MSDAPLPNPESLSMPDVTAGEVTDVLVEQVDAKVAQIEQVQASLQPYQDALASAKQNLQTIQTAASQATDEDAKSVYQKALAVAQQVVQSIMAAGQAVVARIQALQDELRTIIERIKQKDPSHPLASMM